MRNIFLFIPALFLIPSCMKEVAMDAMEEPQVVVECILCDEPVQNLYLTYTKGASRESAPELSEAEARLTDLTEGKEVGLFSRSADGSWELSYSAIPSHNYRLDVSIPGHDPISAEQEMPEVPSLDAEWNWWRENLPADAKYRMVHGYVFSVDTLRDPVWFYGINYPDMDSEGEMTEYLATDYPDVDRFNEQTSTYSGFSTFDSRYFRLSVYPDLMDDANHRHYLRFPPREAERTEFLVSGDFHGYLEDKTDFVHSRKRFPELHYFAASEDYDRFLSDAYQLEEVSASSDLSSIFLRDNVFSNIQGATGIFGAKIERTHLWDDDSHWGEGPFLFSGLETRIDYGRRALGDVDELHFEDLIKIGNGWWLGHKPFSLLHYEVRAGYPEDWKYGIKVNPSEYVSHSDRYQKYRQSIYRIDDDEQLREHGLDGYGPVDFTQKTVIVAYARGNNDAYFPYLMDYWVSEDRTKGHNVHTFYWVHIANKSVWYGGSSDNPSGYVMNPTISSRVAIVVDKIDETDELCLSWWAYYASNTVDVIRPIEEEIFPEMGITDFNVYVDLR